MMLTKYKTLILTCLLLLAIWFAFFADTDKRTKVFPDRVEMTISTISIDNVACPEEYRYIEADSSNCRRILFTDAENDGDSELVLFSAQQNIIDISGIDAGDKLRLNRFQDTEGRYTYHLIGVDRLNAYFVAISSLIIMIVAITGYRGVKSVVSLLVSILIITYVLIPLILKGYDPILVVSVIGMIMFSILIYITNGITRFSTIAILGASVGIVTSIVFTYIFGQLASINGYGEEIGVSSR